MKTVLWKEGKVEVEVPDPSLYPPRGDTPVFFNPRARVSRDLSVLIIKVLQPRQVSDVMCATGIRGIRYAVEGGVKHVLFNDHNPLAVRLTEKNAQRYGIDAEFYQEDVNVLLNERRSEVVDLDPFGSPSPFLQAAGRSVVHKGVMMVTATDTAPLSGASPNSAARKYHVVLRKLPWYKELAVRVLLGYVQHHLMIWEKAMVPIFSYFVEHHVRVIGRVMKRPSTVSRAARLLKIVEGVGPLWTGRLHDREILEETLKVWDEDYSKESRTVLSLASEEIETVGYYNLHLLAKSLKVSVPPRDQIMEELKSMGYEVSRTAFDPRALKTNAPENVLREILTSRKPRP